MTTHSKSNGAHWNAAEIRRERESGWFAEHEADLIENARRRRIEAEEARRRIETAAGSARPVEEPREARRCPVCSQPMGSSRIEGIEVDQCPSCEGIFFHRGELESLLLRHDAHRRGFFRRLLGFDAP